ncbi:hypothetical protein LIER_25579 [Lithospermum erythrorhizon]|uniref:Reverse transcriptase/retrotransposon-derived protein RNase H-like domain-containing protein n=1 Tax=Lithospermum erythrorhizon TaxID=34254 RepID=A0AAV3R5D2_LITER
MCAPSKCPRRAQKGGSSMKKSGAYPLMIVIQPRLKYGDLSGRHSHKEPGAREHESNLSERFDENLEDLRLNPDKCLFGVTSGKFLGYMIIQRGIEPNQDKIAVVQAM